MAKHPNGGKIKVTQKSIDEYIEDRYDLISVDMTLRLFLMLKPLIF